MRPTKLSSEHARDVILEKLLALPEDEQFVTPEELELIIRLVFARYDARYDRQIKFDDGIHEILTEASERLVNKREASL